MIDDKHWEKEIILSVLPDRLKECFMFFKRTSNTPITITQLQKGIRLYDIVYHPPIEATVGSIRSRLKQLVEVDLLYQVKFCNLTLNEKGLNGCGWYGNINKNKCPHCQQKLNLQAYKLKTLTPGRVIEILNTFSENKEWYYDPEFELFSYNTLQLEDNNKKLSSEEIQIQIQQYEQTLNSRLIKELKEIATQAGSMKARGKILSNTYLKSYLVFTKELLDTYPEHVVSYTLEQVRKRKIAKTPDGKWQAYATKVASSYHAKMAKDYVSVQKLLGEEQIAKILVECATLNQQEKYKMAQQKFHELLQDLEQIAKAFFEGDIETTEEYLREAYSKGIDDFQRPYLYAQTVDYSSK